MVGPETLICYDPLGLARVRIPLRAADDVLVLPHPLPPDTLPGPTRAGRCDAPGASARPRSLSAGSGRQLGNLRGYRPGDSLTAVHWRQSARIDRPLVVDRESDARAPRRLALDLRAAAYPDADTFETSVSQAAGIIEPGRAPGTTLNCAWARSITAPSQHTPSPYCAASPR
ncbi:DUF58 domain-containing protein [Actinomyces ruminis]|uniref:DUF58 domain-containing protein n=1 Tax=Actinomyces ruminis TaxID=1937003 RepID=UPI000B6C4CC1|nr:DUF58 domain-containing protein [Actinomyces ruminis]